MKKYLMLSTLFLLAVSLQISLAEQSGSATVTAGNTWTTEDGRVFFTCPVMKGDGLVDHAEGYSDINGLRYYHCCPPCQGPFRAEPERWLSELALPGNIVRVDDRGRKIFRDPITRGEGVFEETTPYADFEHHRYYFLSADGRDRFAQNPQEYIRTLESQNRN